MSVVTAALPISNARSPGCNILDRFEFDAYSSLGNFPLIRHAVDKPIWMTSRISLKFNEYDSKVTSILYLDLQNRLQLFPQIPDVACCSLITLNRAPMRPLGKRGLAAHLFRAAAMPIIAG